MNQNELISISNELLEILLNYKKINSDFTFSLRKRDSPLSKDVKRLDNGQWFQGSNYIYVPLYGKGDNDRKIKTIGFVIERSRNRDLVSFITISFKKGNFSENDIKFHQELADYYGISLDKNNVGQYNFENPENYVNNLTFFLDDFRITAKKLLEKYSLLEKYLVSEEDFKKTLYKIEQIKMNQIKKLLDPNLEIISKYKSILQEGNPTEIYKWELFKKFQERPNLDINDFVNEIQSINYNNLVYHNAIAVRKHILLNNSNDYKEALVYLFDESIDLEERIVDFQKKIKNIYTSLGQTLGHHHDERTISTFLSVKYPEKYPLYKNSFYKTYCEKLGIKSAPKNKKYIHYIELVNTFIKEYVLKDAELLEIKQDFLTEESYQDTNHLLFAQDILYQVLSDKETELDEDENETKESLKISFENNMNQPSNQILYGPPGTGKTYHTINKAVQIANPDFIVNESLNDIEKRKLIKDEYQRLVDVGQIVFTTFHQSMSYEDFIEGIKPKIDEDEDGNRKVIYGIESGLFKRIADKARKPRLKSKNSAEQYIFDDAWSDLVQDINKNLEEETPLVLTIQTPELGLKVVDVSDKGNLNLKPIYSEDSKIYTVSYSRAEKLHQAFPDLSIIKNVNKEFRAVIGGSNSTAYWSVLNYINKKIKEKSITEIKEETLSPLPHVLIIDEINRGNISQIFGELITLIEEDKRLGNDEALEITLPYSKEKFGVPSNLYIIGTMNTADRSVEALDTALRRRFVFEEMPPKYDLEGLKQGLYGFKAAEILQTINKRIEKLLDRDHQIGHAYFINKNETTIIDSFYKNIIPLLQEYFFGDYGKIGLVLGSGFIKIIENKSVFANFEHLDYSQFEEKESYKILGLNDEGFNFENAIKLLMNKK